jgi:hypothetical protein
MDGIHDVGGMDGFGALPPDEPDGASPLHEQWEGRVEAMFLAEAGVLDGRPATTHHVARGMADDRRGEVDVADD